MVKTLLQLGPDDAGMLLTAEEFAAASYLPPFIYERVKGRLVVISPRDQNIDMYQGRSGESWEGIGTPIQM